MDQNQRSDEDLSSFIKGFIVPLIGGILLLGIFMYVGAEYLSDPESMVDEPDVVDSEHDEEPAAQPRQVPPRAQESDSEEEDNGDFVFDEADRYRPKE